MYCFFIVLDDLSCGLYSEELHSTLFSLSWFLYLTLSVLVLFLLKGSTNHPVPIVTIFGLILYFFILHICCKGCRLSMYFSFVASTTFLASRKGMFSCIYYKIRFSFSQVLSWTMWHLLQFSYLYEVWHSSIFSFCYDFSHVVCHYRSIYIFFLLCV